VLLLHLLPALIVSPLLVRTLTVLCLLLLDTLALLVLLPAHVLQLLLMLLLELRIAVRRRIRGPSQGRPVIVRWPIGLRGRRLCIRAVSAGRPIRLRARWRRIRPIIRVRWACGRWPVGTVIIRPIRRTIRLRITRLLRIIRPIGRSIRLRVTWLLRIIRWPVCVGRRVYWPVVLLRIVLILLNVILLLHRAIHVLRGRRAIACIPLRSRDLPCRRSHPHWGRSPSLLLRFRLANL
jgi:hypothetical protein